MMRRDNVRYGDIKKDPPELDYEFVYVLLKAVRRDLERAKLHESCVLMDELILALLKEAA